MLPTPPANESSDTPHPAPPRPATEALQHFLASVDSGDESAAEAQVFTLSAEDVPFLIALASGPGGPEPGPQSSDQPGTQAVDEASDRQWWAVRALAEVGGPEAIPALQAALESRDQNLRATAALATGHLGKRLPEAVEPLLPVLARLLQDPDGFVRQAAVHGFSLCGDVSIPVLGKVLQESPHQSARSRAASALRNLHSVAAAPLLFQCLADENPLVRTYAHEALDELGLLESLYLLP